VPWDGTLVPSCSVWTGQESRPTVSQIGLQPNVPTKPCGSEQQSWHKEDHPGEAELLGRIESFELAYRMQMEATELVDFSSETAETRNAYGIDDDETRSFGSKCLKARRLVERGVRFVQVYSDGEWDAHSDVNGNHRGHCRATDRLMRC
jgi:hypothetical protein